MLSSRLCIEPRSQEIENLGIVGHQSLVRAVEPWWAMTDFEPPTLSV